MKKLVTRKKIIAVSIGNILFPKPKRFAKSFLLLIGSFLMLSGINPLRAQGDGTIGTGPGGPSDPVDLCDPTCEAGSLNISTGYNPINNTWQWPLALETNWTLLSGPPAAALPPNPPCYVINPHPAWSLFPNAKWVSPFTTYSYSYNNCDGGGTGDPNDDDNPTGAIPPPAGGNPLDPFVFQKCFCVCQESLININFELMCDDRATVKLDGNVIGTAMNQYHFQYPNRLVVNLPIFLGQGTHCLTVELYNCWGVAMGFAVEGTVSGSGLMKASCCSANGSICGTKYQDVNCDGRIDPAVDPVLAGWTIILKDNLGNVQSTAVTDANGNYCFQGLPTGTYVVSEQNQFGWVQTYPSSPGTHTINLVAGNSYTADFGNCAQLPPGDICGTKYWDQNCNGVIDPGEPAMGGWTIVLKDNLGNTIATAVTGADGSYCFHNLPAGTYVLSEVNQPGWTQTYPAPPGTHTITIAGNAFVADFANCEGQQPCNVFADWNMTIDKCKVSFQAIIPTLPPGYQLVGTHWTFGDGQSSDLPNPVHYYAAAGTYQVCLTTTIFNGIECCTKTYCQDVTITDPCPGDCHFDANIVWSMEAGCVNNFDLNITSAGTPVTNILWDFGDGNWASGSPIQHTYASAGSYTVCAHVFSTINGTCCFQTFCMNVDIPCNPCEDGTRAMTNTDVQLNDRSVIILNQNVPNPFAENTVISYNIPSDFTKAQMIFTSIDGRVLKTVNITQKGKGELTVFADDLSTGIYFYSLVVDGKPIETRKMIKE